MPRAWLSIGSNQDPARNVREAVARLRAAFGRVAVSPVYESEAVGFAGEPFYNLVAGIDTDLPVAELRRALRAIEDAQGRVRGPDKFASRTLDIDLLTYGDARQPAEGLPRGEILEYAFVLGPLADVAPNERHPTAGQRYGDLWAAFDRASQPMRRLDFDWD